MHPCTKQRFPFIFHSLRLRSACCHFICHLISVFLSIIQLYPHLSTQLEALGSLRYFPVAPHIFSMLPGGVMEL